MEPSSFRQYLPELSSSRFVKARDQTPYEYVAEFRSTQHPKALFQLTEAWESLLEEPFVGVTTDGHLERGLFKSEDGGIDIARICGAAERVLEAASPRERAAVQYPLAAREWRCWSNPEFLLRPLGLRLEEISDDLALLILQVVDSSLSEEGSMKAMAAMRINHFLGELVNLPKIMNKYSYNFLLFGKPSTTEAWGWSLYGHHLCLNVFLKGNHISITPTFTGAEPNMIDEGEFAGAQILHLEGKLGLQLMQSLSSTDQRTAQTYEKLRDEKMVQTGDLKVDRWNADDQRHVCGAFRDNRVVPNEGVRVSSLSTAQKQLVLQIVEQFVLYLPAIARKARLQQVADHINETYFSWIGGWSDADAYYFRIQSPVIICEFDHHSGVFLTNEEPAKFHIHTLVRTPNGGDYGNALRAEGEKVL